MISIMASESLNEMEAKNRSRRPEVHALKAHKKLACLPQLERILSATQGLAGCNGGFNLWSEEDILAQLVDSTGRQNVSVSRIHDSIYSGDRSWEDYLVFADIGIGAIYFAVSRNLEDSQVWARHQDAPGWGVAAKDLEEFIEAITKEDSEV